MNFVWRGGRAGGRVGQAGRQAGGQGEGGGGGGGGGGGRLPPRWSRASRCHCSGGQGSCSRWRSRRPGSRPLSSLNPFRAVRWMPRGPCSTASGGDPEIAIGMAITAIMAVVAVRVATRIQPRQRVARNLDETHGAVGAEAGRLVFSRSPPGPGAPPAERLARPRPTCTRGG